MKLKAQAAMEYLIVVAIALAILTPLIYKGHESMSRLKGSSDALLVRNSIDNIADAAELVHAQGAPAKIKIAIELPHTVVNQTVGPREISLTVFNDNLNSEIFEILDFNVTGNLPTSYGKHFIVIEALNSSWVNISVG